ncbi:Cap15 family cyclic dinucleotide receptor domain-containing protein [Agrobacterium vitis]|uniref:Cap15 family cyclic dinucleotide receptor domain-containing protein n=1 Tax=Agrobacterium vitis TaxID=373 RepID=UPI00398C4AF3
MTNHEYSVVGHSRSSIGRYLAILAAALASAFSATGLLWLQFSSHLGLPPWTQVLAIPISGSVIYAFVHFGFDRWGWKVFFRVTGFPNLDGKWTCDGRTFDSNGNITYNWRGEVTITQSWEKIRVYLRTSQSSSYSVSAAILSNGGGRWMLMYSYRNEPRAGEPINPHLGYCEISFEPGCNRGEGDYFTARGRATLGQMTFERAN